MAELSLFVLSAVIGCVAVWIFRRTTNVYELSRTVRRIQAHFLEFRLFYEEPLLVWRAQKRIVVENARFLILISRPIIILTLPMIWLWVQFDSAYAYAPLVLGQAAMVTAQLNGSVGSEIGDASLQAPAGIAVESSAVRSISDRQISWRIRPLRPVNGELRISYAGSTVEKSVSAGGQRAWLKPSRVRSFGEFLLHPEEARLPAGELRSISIDYPEASIEILGLALPWTAWFIIVSSVSAVIFSRFFRVRQ